MRRLLSLLRAAFRRGRRQRAKDREADLGPAPARGDFDDDRLWLAAWARHRCLLHRASKGRAWRELRTPTGLEAIHLYGSMGFDACLDFDGALWVDDASLTDREPGFQWRRSSFDEVPWLARALAIDGKSEFLALIPKPAPGAVACSACKGAGVGAPPLHVFPCAQCHGWGWALP